MQTEKKFTIRVSQNEAGMIGQIASRDGITQTEVVQRIVQLFFQGHSEAPKLSETGRLLEELKAYQKVMMAAWGYYYQTTGGPEAKKEYETWRKDFYRKVGLQLGGQKNE